MHLAPFDAPRFKVLRARQHIKDLDFELHHMADPDRTLPSNPIGDPEAHTYEHFIRPAMPPLILGDAIHNLRVALDMMACDAVRLNGESTKGVYFPFANSHGELDDQIKSKNFDRAGPVAVAFLKKLQPYKGGNIALRALHDLDVMDKHQLIVPTRESSTPSFLFGDFPAGAWPDELCTRCGQEVKPPKQDGQIAWRGESFFEASAPLAGEKVIPALHNLAHTVRGIIDDLAALLAGANPNP